MIMICKRTGEEYTLTDCEDDGWLWVNNDDPNLRIGASIPTTAYGAFVAAKEGFGDGVIFLTKPTHPDRFVKKRTKSVPADEMCDCAVCR